MRVLLYIPNLISYARILLSGYALAGVAGSIHRRGKERVVGGTGFPPFITLASLRLSCTVAALAAAAAASASPLQALTRTAYHWYVGGSRGGSIADWSGGKGGSSSVDTEM